MNLVSWNTTLPRIAATVMTLCLVGCQSGRGSGQQSNAEDGQATLDTDFGYLDTAFGPADNLEDQPHGSGGYDSQSDGAEDHQAGGQDSLGEAMEPRDILEVDSGTRHGTCGDGICHVGESCSTCPEDCGGCCGNGLCEPLAGEDCEICPLDCPCLVGWFALEQAVESILLGPEKVVTAQQVRADLTQDPTSWFVVDVRGTALYANAHIPQAVEIGLGNLSSAAAQGQLPTGRRILLVCTTGQRSGWAAALLQLMGFDAWSLAHGMPTWNAVGDNMWNTACSDGAAGMRDTAAYHLGTPMPHPDVDILEETIPACVAGRANAILSGAFKTRNWWDVSGALDSYTVIAHVPAAAYSQGHLPGAIHFEPGLDPNDQTSLLKIPPGKPVLVVDCAGNWSSGIAALLNVLGYDAWFLRFGESGLWCSQVPDCGWSASKINSFPVE
jgi:rhodanese-related sulfurtransferase